MGEKLTTKNKTTTGEEEEEEEEEIESGKKERNTTGERHVGLLGCFISQLTHSNISVRLLVSINGLLKPLSRKVTASFATASGTKQKPGAQRSLVVACSLHCSRVQGTKPNHSTQSAIKIDERERDRWGGGYACVYVCVCVCVCVRARACVCVCV